MTHWTGDMDRLLREAYTADGAQAAADALGVTRSAVKNRAHQLGLRRPSPAWTPAEDAVLLNEYAAGVAAPVIAARLGRGIAAVRRRANVLGVISGRWWSPAAVERVRTAYAAVGAKALAIELLGESTPKNVYLVYRLAERLDVTVPIRHPPWVCERVRELHARGMNDRQIARALADYLPGRNDRERVTALRRRLGLPAIKPTAEQKRERGREGRSRQSGDPRGQAYARLAASYGLPAGTPPRAVEVLLALASGPKTRAELEALGLHPARLWNAEGTSYVAGLVRRGLVATASTGTVRGGRVTYLLTALAMDLLAKGGAGADSGQG